MNYKKKDKKRDATTSSLVTLRVPRVGGERIMLRFSRDIWLDLNLRGEEGQRKS